MAKGIKRKIRRALNRVDQLISDHANRSESIYSKGLAPEGYHGGYSAALRDVLLALDGMPPCVRPEYWIDSRFDD